MKKCFTLMLTALLCLSALAGCASSGAAAPGSPDRVSSPPAASSSSQDASSTDASAAHYPVTVSNYNAAREKMDYTYEKAPERVVCLWSNSVENMLALGLGDKIVLAAGVTAEEILPEYQEEFKKVQALNSKWPTKEAVVALQPDLIVAWYSTFSDDKYWGDNAFWNQRGVGTYISLNSGVLPDQTLENEYSDILALGKIFDVEDRAQALVSEMRQQAEQGRAAAKAGSSARVLILENEKDAFRNYGETAIGGSIATQVGAQLCEKDKSKRLSAEDLVSLNPEMIFAVYFGDEIGKEECVKDFTENPAFQSLDAVKNGTVYPIDLSLIYCPGIRVKNSIDYFVSHLYPEL